MLAEKHGMHVVGGDVNAAALAFAQKACPKSRVSLLRGDLTTWARPATFDVVIFNPPYVPTEVDEMARALRERDIAASWAGGDRGREVIDMCMHSVRECLVDGGVFYLVVEKANGVDELVGMARDCGFAGAELIRDVVAGRERLFVLRFTAG
jgi:methylase of polypeptide subunit release factors